MLQVEGGSQSSWLDLPVFCRFLQKRNQINTWAVLDMCKCFCMLGTGHQLMKCSESKQKLLFQIWNSFRSLVFKILVYS